MPRSQLVSADACRADTRYEDGRHRFRLRCRAVGAMFVLASVFAVVAFPQAAAAQVPQPPANGDCQGTAVVAKLSVVEDQAAANMLAEAATILGLGQRCLVDAGDPTSGTVPSGSRSELSNADRIFVVGGPAAIPHDWLTSTLGVSNYTRIAGGNRWDTQSAVASAIVSLARGESVVAYAGQPSSTPQLPPNTDCTQHAVIAKLSIVEDQAAANMFAEALRSLSPNGRSRCLIDIGDPRAGVEPDDTAVAQVRAAEITTVVGGPAAIPDSWLRGYFDLWSSRRLQGRDRWLTQEAVAIAIVTLVGQNGTDGGVLRFSSDEIIVQRGSAISSQIDLTNPTIQVYYCGPEDDYSPAALNEMEVLLNQHVTEFFRRQSNGKSVPEFEARGVVSPNIVWSAVSISQWNAVFEVPVDEDTPKYSVNDCLDLAVQESGSRRTTLVLADVPLGGTTLGFAFLEYLDDGSALGLGPALMATDDIYGDSQQFLRVAAHELGHSLYGLQHTAGDLRSLMNATDEANVTLVSMNLATAQRCRLGWLDDAACSGSDDVRPEAPNLEPRDQSIRVGLDASGSFEIQYRRSDGSHGWVDWHARESTIVAGEGKWTTIDGLNNGVAYDIRIRQRKNSGFSEWSLPATETPQSDESQSGGPEQPVTVTLAVGPDARGAVGSGGPCTGVHCRWLHVDVNGLDSGSYTLACAHNGVAGFARGVYASATVSSWPNDSSCFFGYPGAEVFVIVGAEHRDGQWYGGYYSNVVTWPDCSREPNRCGGIPPPRVQISWGTDGSNRNSCPAGIRCTNLTYQIEGLGNGPWRLNCIDDAGGITPFLWSGNPATGCWFSGTSGNVWVEVDGHRSNALPRSTRPR